MKKTVSLTIDENIYNEFQEKCRKESRVYSQVIERIMYLYVKNMITIHKED